MKTAGILTIGDEILQGYTFDLNATTISKELTKRNINVTIHLSVPDSVSKIAEKIDKFIQKDYDYVFVTGGLGPTHDDVTKKALLELFDAKLIFLEDRHKELEQKYLNKSKNRNIDKSQSEILSNSEPINNHVGTALGMLIKENNTEVVVLPGVPNEMNEMLLSYLDQKGFKINTNRIVTINTAGIYESKVSEKIQDIVNKYKNYFSVSYLPNYEGVKIRITSLDENKINIEEIKSKIVESLSGYVYGLDNVKLEETLSKLLIKKELNISLAESCTGGFIAKSITDIPGSSAYFLGSIVAYDNRIKENILGVSSKLIEEFGAVSSQVSESMAINVCKKFKSDISISCTGISGPEGGTDSKPVGTVYISIKFQDTLVTKKFIFKLDREFHRVITKQTALYMLWRLLKE
tara:strand:- start:548 stop:1768 length:1221 start_codon:yes stop_codon:yes gene_type:complete